MFGAPASIIGSEPSSLLSSDPLSWIETFVTFCGMVGLQAMVLGRLGRKPSLIQERVLYPAHRHLRAGAAGAPASIMLPLAALVSPIVPGTTRSTW